MHRIDTPDAVANKFSPGIPGSTLATTVSADWLNAVQEEPSNVIEAAGIVLDKSDNTQLRQAIASIAGSRAGSRNLFANGSFTVWQRDTASSSGVSVAVTSAAGEKYTSDRWYAKADGAGGAGQVTCSQQTFTPGQTDVLGEPEFFMRCTQAIAATLAAPRFGQKLESVRTGAGSSMAASVSLKANASISVDLVVTQVFGSGGSADVEVSRTPLAVGSGWNRYVVSALLPGLEGKVITTADYLDVRLEGPTGQTYTLDVADFQFENGAAASTYDRRPLELELAYCGRFYEKSWPWNTPVGTNTALGQVCGPENGFDDVEKHRAMATRFRVPKRTIPTVVWYGSTSVINKISYAASTGNVDVAVTSSRFPSQASTGWPQTAGAGSPGVTNVTTAHFTADAEL